VDAIREDFDRIAELAADEPGPYDDWLAAAIDLSPKMIARARACVPPRVELVVADVTRWPFPDEKIDCAVTIATLHHLPFEETLARLAGALTPGGRLLVHDLVRDHGIVDRMRSAIALAANLPRRVRARPEVRAAWAAHAQHDHLLSFDQVRARARAILPGAKIVRHLKWRYSLVWINGR